MRDMEDRMGRDAAGYQDTITRLEADIAKMKVNHHSEANGTFHYNRGSQIFQVHSWLYYLKNPSWIRNFRSGSRRNLDNPDSFSQVWLPYLSLSESCLLHCLFATWSVFASLMSRADNIVQRSVVHMLFFAMARKLSYTVPNISANNPNNNNGRIHIALPTYSFNVVNSNVEWMERTILEQCLVSFFDFPFPMNSPTWLSAIKLCLCWSEGRYGSSPERVPGPAQREDGPRYWDRHLPQAAGRRGEQVCVLDTLALL